MMIPTSLVIAIQFPKLPLQTILSIRTFGSTIFNELNELSVKDHLIMNILDFKPDQNHYIMASTLILFLYGQYKYNEGMQSIDNRIVKIDRFKKMKKIMSELLLVLVIVFTKNVTEVF